MKPMTFSIAALVLAGCQVPASLSRRPATDPAGSWSAPAADGAGARVAAAEAPRAAAGGDPHPELARVGGVRAPHPYVRLVNLAADPDPARDSSGDDDLEAWCPDRGSDDLEHLPTSPNLPDLRGKTLDQALAVLEGLGRYCVIVTERSSCESPQGTPLVCYQSSQHGVTELDVDSPIELAVQTDVAGRGTASETHRVPVLKHRKTKEVLADLERRGFTNVQVVRDAQCDAGVVCWADPDPDDFQALSESVILHVRE